MDVTGGMLKVIDRIHGEEPPYEFDPDTPLLHIYFPRIFDCDGALIVSCGETAVIDCCDAYQAPRLVNVILAAGVRRIDYLFNTHPHHDHLDGLAAVVDAAQVSQLLICFHEFYNTRMTAALSVARERNIPVVHYGNGDVFQIGNAELNVIQVGEADWNINEKSAIMRLSFGECSMLFMADTQPRTFAALAAMPDTSMIDADILKYPHHGVEILTQDFLEASSPLYAIITNTDRVTDAIALLDSCAIPYALTGQGAVHCVTDGSVWVIEPFDVEDAMRG